VLDDAVPCGPVQGIYYLKKDVLPPMYWHGLIKGNWKGPGHHSATRILQGLSNKQQKQTQ
jgi:hypothetical protein